jgi:hypothetical protein
VRDPERAAARAGCRRTASRTSVSSVRNVRAVSGCTLETNRKTSGTGARDGRRTRVGALDRCPRLDQACRALSKSHRPRDRSPCPELAVEQPPSPTSRSACPTFGSPVRARAALLARPDPRAQASSVSSSVAVPATFRGYRSRVEAAREERRCSSAYVWPEPLAAQLFGWAPRTTASDARDERRREEAGWSRASARRERRTHGAGNLAQVDVVAAAVPAPVD